MVACSCTSRTKRPAQCGPFALVLAHWKVTVYACHTYQHLRGCRMIALVVLLLVAVAALLTVALCIVLDSLEPFEPHPDISKIQWPVPADPTIVVERRKQT